MIVSMLPVHSPLSLRELIRRESLLRLGYIETLPETESSSHDVDPDAVQHLLSQSVAVLELTLVSACLFEAARHLGITTGSELGKYASELLAEAKAMSCLDPLAVVSEHVGDRSQAAPLDFALPPTALVVNAVRATVAACPIARLEILAAQFGSPALGHRCRVAFDALRAFLMRQDPETQQRMRAVGHAYTQGAIGISQASEMLGMTVPDLVASFEKLGYARSLDTIRLGSQRREEVLAAMRTERQKRNGAPTADLERAARHTLASERIELVDARQWIHIA
ncbi:MAG TPA: hypothetical protein VG963_20665 [Polyangiaceae bacterium]|nr:hypothetical protein [Polyangiaceae bacterium]